MATCTVCPLSPSMPRFTNRYHRPASGRASWPSCRHVRGSGTRCILCQVCAPHVLLIDIIPDPFIGTFNTIFLYVLAFNTSSRKLSISSKHDAFGPHQYIAKSVNNDMVYATTWALPPSLGSWNVNWQDGIPLLEFLNKAPISE